MRTVYKTALKKFRILGEGKRMGKTSRGEKYLGFKVRKQGQTVENGRTVYKTALRKSRNLRRDEKKGGHQLV